jgi:hypothetical protein
VFAIILIVSVAALFADRELNRSVQHYGIEDQINETARRLDLGEFKVYAQPSDDQPKRWPIRSEDEEVFVFLHEWEA